MSPSRRSGGRLVPAYLAAEAGPAQVRTGLDRLTVLSATADGVPQRLSPPQHRLVSLVRGGALTLAEAAAHLDLPVSVVRLVVSQLLERGHIAARAPIPAAQLGEQNLLERVLRGLQAAV
ncbi:DUF742 domain-containing protein [Streptomyces niveus]|uniref:DUF742 domain-containing protein n=1 Tax=Streptomyces niveus TaxID=193462 RepID=UPI0036B01718